MKNISLVLLVTVVGSLSACSSTQETTTTGTTPTPVVTVPVAEPVAEKPKEDKPTEPEDAPPPEDAPSAGRLALQQCTEVSRKIKSCAKESKPVCAEVDTGIRCIRAPCPSTIQQTFDNACTACTNSNVRGYWAVSCEELTKPTAP
jgi:hypothetical protein